MSLVVNRGKAWLRYLALLAPFATVAATVALYRYGPPVWRLYIHYSVRLVTHPLVALFLILTISTLAIVMILRRRHRSEFLALCFLLSALLHLLTVAFFSLWIVQQDVAEMVEEDTGRHELMTGLPSFSENAIGEDLRGLLQEIAAQDRRELDARSKTAPAAERTPDRKPVELATPERLPPAPDRTALSVDQAARAQAVEEQLEALETALRNRDTTKLVQVKPIETPREQPKPESPAAPALTAPPADSSFQPTEQRAATPESPAPSAPRPAPERVDMAMAPPTPATPRMNDSPQPRQMTHPVDHVTMQARVQETPRPVDAKPVEPAERNVGEAVDRRERATDAEQPADARKPEFTPARPAESAVRVAPQLPSFTRPANAVSEAQAIADVSERAPDGVALNLTMERPLLPRQPADGPAPAPSQPAPRTLAPNRVAESRTETPLSMERPTVETPEAAHTPSASPAPTVAARPTEAPRVAETLAQRPDTPALTPAPAVRGTIATLSSPETPRPAAAPVQPARTLDAARRHAPPAAVALPATGPTTDTHMPPDAQPPQATSLADARHSPTATPAVPTPTVSEHIADQAPVLPTAPAITILVGGRLMLVEPSPRVAALEPAPLSRRDIATARRQEREEAATEVPLPTATRVVELPGAAPRVTQQSIAVSDSVRMVRSQTRNPTVDAALATVTPGPRADVVPVGQSLTTIAMPEPVTADVADRQAAADARTFTRERVARDTAATALPDPRTAPVVLAASATAATHSAPGAFRDMPADAHAAARDTPRAADDIQSTPATAHATASPDAVVATRMNAADAPAAKSRPAGPQPADASPDAASASRDLHAARIATTVGATGAADPGPAMPTAAGPVAPDGTPRTATRAWTVDAPTVAERTSAPDAAAASPAPAVPMHAVVAIGAPMAAAPSATSAAASRPTEPQPADTHTLDVARVGTRGMEASRPEDAIPPPRTTFVVGASVGTSATRLLPADASATTQRSDSPRPAAAERLADVRGAASAAGESPVMRVAARGDTRPAAPAANATGGAANVARGRSFDIARSGSHETADMPRDAARPAAAPPRPDAPDRAHERGAMDIARTSDTRVAAPDESSTTAGDAVRGLMTAEVAASRESPSRKAIYQLRSSDKRKRHIEELGGSAETESAVEQALDWLASAQSDDGHWDVNDFKGADRCGGRGNQESADVGITGLTLLSFLGAGYTHVDGKHHDRVKKAIDWIVAGMTADGDLRRGGQMYDQAMAAAALCEAISLTGDRKLAPAAERAIAFILAAQNPEAAWRYNPREDNDTSVTGWQILALKSAEVAGIAVPPQHYRWTEKWLDQVRRGDQGGLYLYREGHAVTPVMTAEGWFCQIFMGQQSKTRGQEESVGYLMQYLPVWSREIPGAINFYYWYYATLALHLSGSESFGVWNDALTAALLQGRVTEGPAAGTWDPIDHVGARGGRIYSTAVATLCLEVYYRFLPFYKLK